MLLQIDIMSPQVMLAVIGGFTVNVLNLLELRNVPRERRPDFHDILYWLPFLIWPILGGVVAYLYNDSSAPLTKIVAFHIGMSAPLILRSMANVVPHQVQATLPPGA